jgi:CO dehydrogenase/acetyl-CoA synthase beta subunit
MIADATMMLFHNELPFIEKIEAIFVTDEAKSQRGNARSAGSLQKEGCEDERVAR